MQRTVVLGFILILIPAAARAQSSEGTKAQASVFCAPGALTGGGATTSTVHFGGGGEALVYKGLGVGAEIGYLTPWDSFGDGIGIFSANGSYNFFPRHGEKKLVPFVTGGYSLFFRSGSANGFNFGGGVNWWLKPKLGLRLEFRDQVWPGRYDSAAHFFEFRVGLAFR